MKKRNYKTVALITVSFAAFITLSACSTGRNYHRPNTAGLVQETFAAQSEYRFRASQPVTAWWEKLDDDQLNRLLNEALVHNHDVRIALSNLQEARAFVRETALDRYPTVEAQANAARQRLSDEGLSGPVSDRVVSTYQAGFDAFWELDVFGRISQRIAASNATMEAREAELHAVYVTIGAEVARAYIELRGAQYRLDVASRNVANQRQTYHLIQELFESGRSDALDTSRAKAQLELTRSTIPPLIAGVNAAINRLGVLTGKPPDTLQTELREAQPLPSMPQTINVGSPVELLKRRPDIRRTERELAASVAIYNLNVADLYPQVTLFGSLGFSATSFSDLTTAGASTALLGPGINWAAFNLGRVKSRIEAADARTRARLAAFEQTVLRALEETDTAMVNFSREEQRRARLFEAASASATAAEYARARFNAGTDSFLDVLDADRTMLEAQDLLARSETEMALDLIAIYKALGGGWQVYIPM